MRALVLSDWWKFELREIPDPALSDGEVLLEVLATGVCGSDIHGFTGETGRREIGQVMGHETVARVAELSPGVGSLDVGSLVTVNPVFVCRKCKNCLAGREQACESRFLLGVDPRRTAAFAELMAVPATNVIPLGDDVPSAHGALVEPLAVGYHAARRAECAPNDTVLVFGGGPIGQACLLAAQRLGASAVVVSEPHENRRRVAASLGALAVDPREVSVLDACMEHFGGRPDVVIDAVGTAETIRCALDCSQSAGRIVLVGMGAPNVELPAYEVSTKERSLLGSFCYSAEDFRETADWVSRKPDKLGELIDGIVTPDQAQKSFSELARGTTPSNKILVAMSAKEAVAL